MGVYITGVTLEEMLDPHKHSTLFSALSLDGEEPVLIATRRGIKLIEVKTPHGKLVDVYYLFVKLQEALQDEEDTRTATELATIISMVAEKIAVVIEAEE